MSEKNERKSFWGWLGLPDAADMRELRTLLQTQSAQLTRMETENHRLAAALERSKRHASELKSMLITRQERCAAQTAREIMQSIRACASEISQKLDSVSHSAAEQREALIFVGDKTLDTLKTSAQNQDELLRILVVNALQEECDTILNGAKPHGKRKK